MRIARWDDLRQRKYRQYTIRVIEQWRRQFNAVAETGSNFNMTSDNDLYKSIADELSSKTMDSALWTRAFSEAEGDLDKSKAIYIRLRFAALKKSAPASTSTQTTIGDGSPSDIKDLRYRIHAKLAVNKRATLYQSLGLQASCSDSDIAARVHAIASEAIDAGISVKPEVKYAMDILRDPSTREQYDRKLWDDVSGGFSTSRPVAASSTSQSNFEDDSSSLFMGWWSSKKVSVIIGVASVVVVGYLARDVFSIRKSHEVQKEIVKVQREAVNAAGAADIGRVDNQRFAIEEQARIQNMAIDRSAELINRSLSIEEERERRERAALEYRADAQSRALDIVKHEQENRVRLQRERMENTERMQAARKAERESKYWACMNAAMDRYKNDSARASQSCSAYR